MEVWREELYHGLLANLKGRLKLNSGAGSTIGKKSVGPVGKASGTGKGREWTKHKYVRKEGSRYIYPEDLKKKQSKKPSISERKNNAWSGKRTGYDSDKNSKVDAQKLFRSYGVDGGNTYIKGSSRIKLSSPKGKDSAGNTRYNMMTSASDHKGTYKYSKKRENEIREAHGDDNKRVMVSRWNDKNPIGSTSDILFSTVEYKNGKNWFKSNITVDYTEEHVNKGEIGGTDTRHKVHYTVEYSKFRQGINRYGSALNKLHNSGKSYIDSLKEKKETVISKTEKIKNTIADIPEHPKEIIKQYRNYRIRELNKKLEASGEHNRDISTFIDKHILDISPVYRFGLIEKGYDTSLSGYNYIPEFHKK